MNIAERVRNRWSINQAFHTLDLVNSSHLVVTLSCSCVRESIVECRYTIYEPLRGKTNNVVSEQA